MSVADSLDQRLQRFRDTFQQMTTPYVARGQRIVPRHELTCVMDAESVQVRVRVWKPKEAQTVLAEFSGELYQQLREQVHASRVSWEAFMEGVCLGR